MPFHHQYLLAQMVKGIIASDPQKRFHNFQTYNFSGLKGQTKVSKRGLHFYSSRITLVFSATDKSFVDYFLTRLFQLQEVQIGNLTLEPETVEIEEKVRFQEMTKFICISPVVILSPTFYDQKGKKFIDPATDEFSDLLYEATMLRLEQYGRYEAESLERFYKFQVVPDKAYLTRMNNAQKKFARIYPLFDQDVKYEVRGYTFPFELYAAPEVQQFVFECGLGLFSHKGFGMLDIAHADPNQRVIKYEFSYA